MVGDRIKRDIETAKKLGIKTCYARYGDKKPAKKGKSGADWEISGVREVVRVLGEFRNSKNERFINM